MADNDVRIKLSLDGADAVQSGLSGVGEGATDADSKLGKLGSGLAGVGTAFAGLATVAVGAGVALGGAVIGAYADYEQNIGGIETLFGAGGKSAEEFAASVGQSVEEASGKYDSLMQAQELMISNSDNAYRTAGVSANDYMENVTSFSAALVAGLEGDTLAAANVADMAMVDMSDNANKFGSNISDIQNAYQGFAKQNFTMLDNLKLGYGGTQEEMARLINDSGVMGDTFTATAKNLDEVSFDKVIEAINVVQTEMGVTGTTAKEATETISGSIGMLGASWENLLIGLGSGNQDVGQLAENVVSSLESVIGNIAPIIGNIGDNMATLGPAIGDMMNGLVDVVVETIPVLLEAGVSIIEGLVTGITTSLPTLITALVPGIIGLVEMVVEQLPLLLDAGIQAVIALADGLSQALPDLIPLIVDGILNLVYVILENLPTFIEAGIDLIIALGEGLLEAIPQIIERIPELIDGILGALIEAQPLLLEGSIQLFTAIIDALPEIITAITEALPELISGIVDALTSMSPEMGEAYVELFGAIVEALPEIIEALLQVIPAIGEAIFEELKNLAPDMSEKGVEFFSQLVVDYETFKTIITDVIPRLASDLFAKIEEKTTEMAAKGLAWFISMVARAGEIITTITNVVPAITSSVFGRITSSISEMASTGYNFFISMISRAGEFISQITSAVSNLVTTSISTVASFTGQMASTGYELFMALIANIGGVISNVVGALNGLVSSGVSAVRSGAGDMASAGLALVQGIWQGILSGGSWLRGQIQGWAQGIIDSAKAAFRIKSPSQVFRDEIGKQIVLGLAVGIENNIYRSTQATKKLSDSVISSARNMRDGVAGVLSDISATYLGAFEEIDVAFHGGDWGYGSLSTLVGDEAALLIVNSADKVGSALRYYEELLEVAATEIREAYLGGDWGTGALQEIFGEQVATDLFWAARRAGAALRSYQDTINAEVSKFEQTGKNISQGIWDGFTRQNPALASEVARWSSWLTNNFKKSFGIRSPSTVFRDEVGKNIALGFAEGIDTNAWRVEASFDKMFSDVLAQAEDFTKNMNDATSGINAGATVLNSTTELLNGTGGLFGMLGTGASLAGGVASIAGLVGAGPVAAAATAVAAALGVGAAIPSLLDAGAGLLNKVLELPIISDIASFFGHKKATPQEKTPTYATMPTITTGNYVRGNDGTVFSGPLIQVESMNVRNDDDIRKISTQLRTDMNRELRARGVLS